MLSARRFRVRGLRTACDAILWTKAWAAHTIFQHILLFRRCPLVSLLDYAIFYNAHADTLILFLYFISEARAL